MEANVIMAKNADEAAMQLAQERGRHAAGVQPPKPPEPGISVYLDNLVAAADGVVDGSCSNFANLVANLNGEAVVEGHAGQRCDSGPSIRDKIRALDNRLEMIRRDQEDTRKLIEQEFGS